MLDYIYIHEHNYVYICFMSGKRENIHREREIIKNKCENIEREVRPMGKLWLIQF